MIRPGRERARRDRNYLRDFTRWIESLNKISKHAQRSPRYPVQNHKPLLKKGRKP